MKDRIYEIDDIKKGSVFKADVVVVGSGCGGAVVASSLAEKGFNVIVVEEGKYYRVDEFPENFVDAMKKFYRERGMRAAIGNTVITIPVARVLGGASVVNSNICFRIPDFILDKWEQETGFEIDREELNNYYEKIEKLLQVGKPREEIRTGNDKIHKRAADLMGWSNDYFDLNSPGCDGCNRCNMGCPVAGKTSMDVSFIPRAVNHGAMVLTSTRADKIIVKNGSAKGLVCSLRDPDTGYVKGKIKIYAKGVVLACGAMETPVLLMKNKLCGNNGWLGKNLHIHPGIGVFGFFPDEDVYFWKGVFQGHFVDEFIRDGFVIETASVPPEAVFSGMPLIGKEGVIFLKKLKHLTTSGAMIRDSSSGIIEPGEGEHLKIRYSVNRDDLKKFVNGLNKICTMLLKAGAEWVYAVTTRGEFIKSIDAIHRLINYDIKASELILYASHPQGTARIGSLKDRTIVNNDGETHEVENLFITDASILPSAPGVNPQIGIMTLSYYLSERIARKL